jgi:hypothetical protein
MADKVLSHDAEVHVLPTADIGGTNTATIDATYWGAWHDVKGYSKIYGKLMIGATWNAGDDVDTCKLQQATSSAGAGAKDLTTSGSGYGYDSDYPVDAAGNTVVLEARAEDLDVAGGFHYVRLYAAETGDTGTDNVAGVLILYGAVHEEAEKEAAASSGAVVYVTPD